MVNSAFGVPSPPTQWGWAEFSIFTATCQEVLLQLLTKMCSYLCEGQKRIYFDLQMHLCNIACSVSEDTLTRGIRQDIHAIKFIKTQPVQIINSTSAQTLQWIREASSKPFCMCLKNVVFSMLWSCFEHDCNPYEVAIWERISICKCQREHVFCNMLVFFFFAFKP